MANTVSFNPYGTQNTQTSFLQETQGYIQGLARDDTVARMWLEEGTLATSETLPMWGGVPITELVNVTGSGPVGLGSSIKRATAAPGSSSGATTGFSVFNQMAHMIIAQGAPVPLSSGGNGVGYFRIGTNARIAVACDPALVTALTSSDEPITEPALYWDTTYYRITLTTSSNFALTNVRLL